MPAWVRWMMAMIGATAVTGGLFLVMPSMIRIGDPEPGRALIAWQAANPPEYGGIFLRLPALDEGWDRSAAADFDPLNRIAACPFPDIEIPPQWDSVSLTGSLAPLNAEIVLPIEAAFRSSETDLNCISDRMRANYPATALERQLEGNVVVLYDLSEDGRAVNARVASASHPVFADHVARQIANCGVDAEPASRDLPFHLEYRLDL